jgi:hypothetical protein
VEPLFSLRKELGREANGLNSAYLIYQILSYVVSANNTQSLNQLFGFNLGISFFNGQKHEQLKSTKAPMKQSRTK